MKHVSRSVIGLTAVAVLGRTPASAHAQAADTTARIDTAAMNALTEMGAYLRGLKAFEVRAAVTTESVMLDGQKVQTSSEATLVAEKPNHLQAEVTDDHKQRRFFYNGKDFTIYAPRTTFYATVPAPPTLAELMRMLEDKYDVDLPFVDLFRWGTPEANTSEITAAKDLGPSQIGGTNCDHYAFRQPGLDWEIWIQSGEYPLPRKIVLTTLTDDARPQHTSVYTWNLAPAFNVAAFTFDPPKDAKQITIAEAKAMRTAAKAEEKRK